MVDKLKRSWSSKILTAYVTNPISIGQGRGVKEPIGLVGRKM
jgi:hypothetical protein